MKEQHQCDDEQVFRPILVHNVRIIDDPGHQVAHFVVVKELEIQRMQMGEQIGACGTPC